MRSNWRKGLADIPGIAIEPERIETNIVIFEWQGGPHADFMKKLAEAGVLASSSGAPKVRMVTHYGVNAEDIEEALDAIRTALPRRRRGCQTRRRNHPLGVPLPNGPVLLLLLDSRRNCGDGLRPCGRRR